MTLSNKTVLRIVKEATTKRLSRDAVVYIREYLIREIEALTREAEAELAAENVDRARIGERPRKMIGLRQVNRALGARTPRVAPGAGDKT